MTIISHNGGGGIIRAGGILDRIVDARKKRLERAKRELPFERLISEVESQAGSDRASRFHEAITRIDRINIIAEMKRRSPSKGIIRERFEPAAIASNYERAGAAAVSVLTEEDFFEGSLDHLAAARRATSLPLLRKDFIFDPYQVYEAARAGASAILLIAAILDDELLRQLSGLARSLGLASLVEVHTDLEMDRALGAGARVLGVNNRDLTSFDVDLGTSLRLSKAAPPDFTLVSESGIRTREDIMMLKDAGYHAFLIGERFMVAEDPGGALRELIGGSMSQ